MAENKWVTGVIDLLMRVPYGDFSPIDTYGSSLLYVVELLIALPQ